MRKFTLFLCVLVGLLLPAGLRAQSCSAPTNLTVSNITDHTADLTWVEPSGVTWRDVQYSLYSDFHMRYNDYPSGPSVQLTGLTAGKIYYVHVKYECPGTWYESSWSDVVSFTTTGGCPTPTNLTANVGLTNAVISWSQPGGADDWEVSFSKNPDFNLAQLITTNDTSYSCSGLTPNTTYYVKVRANCGATGESYWSNEVSLTTADGTNETFVEIGHNQFMEVLPTQAQVNYSLSEQIYTPAEIGRSGTIRSIGFFNTDGTMTRNIDLYLAHTNKNAFSSNMDWTTVTAADRVFSGNVTFAGLNWTIIEFDTPFDYNGSDNLLVMMEDNTGGSEPSSHYFLSYDGPNQALLTYSSANFNPPPYFSGNLMSAKNYLLLGFALMQCQSPHNFNISCNNLQREATLTWDCNATDFIVEYKLTNDTTWQSLTTTSNSVTLSNLAVGDYNVRVKGICDPGVYESNWGTTAFTIINIQSTANWYTRVFSSAVHSEWSNKYVTFSMQDLDSGATASSNLPYTIPAITYADGYVWSANYNYNQQHHDLFRAPINDTTRTIGAFETVKSAFEDNFVECMSYNPIDGRIYYVMSGHIVKSFHPSSPDVKTVVCDVDNLSIVSIAFNNQGEAFIIGDYGSRKLYRLNLTDASYTSVGSISTGSYLAFDLTTGELFCSAQNSNGGYQMWLVDPVTADMQSIGFLGRDTNIVCKGLFMIPNSSATLVNVGSCSSTQSFLPSASQFDYTISEQIYTATEIGDAGIINSISFFNTGSAVTRNLDIYLVHTNKTEFYGDDWVPVTATDLVFSGNVTLQTNVWSEITLDVPFSYNGTDNLVVLTDDNTGTRLNNLLCSSFVGLSPGNKSMYSCGYSENYNPLTLSNYPGFTTPAANCLQLRMTPTCQKPYNLTVTYDNQHNTTLTWECNATNFNVEYKKTNETTWHSLTTTTHSVTLSGMDMGDYEARVRAVCTPGVSESDWRSITFPILNIQSTSKWYTYVTSSFDHYDWSDKCVAFSMQDITIGTPVSAAQTFSQPSITYADGYVWATSYDPSHHYCLLRAPMDNDTRIIGAFDTVRSVFETDFMEGLSYNPADGKIYYVSNNHTVKSFHPSSPDNVSTVCTVSPSIYIRDLAFNSRGEAYAYDELSGSLYRLNMTDASLTFVGNLTQAVFLSFDDTTDELFCSRFIGNGYTMGLVDTATAAVQDIGYLGDDDYIVALGLFMVSGTANIVGLGSCSTGSKNLPSNTYNDYGLSQQIYTAAEISRSGSISSISLYNSSDAQNRNYDIYLVHTNKTSFSSTNDWVPVTAADLVFSGNVEMKTDEWTSIDLDVPFAYNGTDNLLLVMDDNTGSWISSMSCYSFTTTNTQALYINNDNSNFDPTAPGSYNGSLVSEKNCIQLNFTTICPKPKDLAVSNINHNEVTLTWSSSATDFNVEYKKTTDTQWQQTSTTGNTITLSGLDYTSYQARVKAVCDTNLQSDWVETSFILFDLQSTANWYSFVISSTAHSNWTDRYVSFPMQNISSANTASELINNYFTSNAYANGYVWYTNYNYNQGTIDLGRAPLDNVNKTIGYFETVKENFDTTDVFSMAYNPIDDKLYYVGGDYKLKSFDPANPSTITAIGTYAQDFKSLSINRLGEAYCVAQDDSLYRMNLANASVTTVGYFPDVEVLAFDMETDELFCISLSSNGHIICSVDPATAAKQELTYVGGDPDIILRHLFMASSSAQVCYAPTNLDFSSIAMNDATLTWDTNANASGWVVEYATLPDFSNATAVTTTTNSCLLTGLVGGTTYHVRVKANCGAGSESYWTVRSFSTTLCESSDQCKISYSLADSYGDGWNGCAINVVDVATGFVFGTLTINYGDSLSGTLPICDGRDIRFEWVNGSFADETSYTVYDAEGNIIFNGSGAMSAPLPYTVICPVLPELISIGTCTSGNDQLPSDAYYNYGLSQQIYTAAEIGRPGSISSVSFYNSGDAKTRNYDVYLVHTNKTSFSSVNDWVSVTAANLVFSGNIEMKTDEWTPIDLDVPFAYNGTDNLLLVVDDNTGSWSSSMSCHTFASTDPQALYINDDDPNFYPSTPGSYYGSLLNEKNCIQLNFGTVCPKPKNLTASTNHNEVTLTWTSNATDFNVEYKKTSDTLWQQTSATGNAITLSGLDYTSYQARVKAVCDTSHQSDWVETSFILFDLQSTANWYSLVTSSPTHYSWMNKYVSFSMQNLTSASTASELINNYFTSTAYANGYVWYTNYNYNQGTIDLGRAPLDNVNKTIGNFETVKENFDTADIFCMTYNPIDDKLYYVGGDYKLKSFDPANPSTITAIGTYAQDINSISINRLGDAYCVAQNDSLYRMNLTNASVTLVGYLPDVEVLAFDMETDELFCISLSNTGNIICSVDPATAAKQELNYIGGEPDIYHTHLFMASGSAQVCYAPTNLEITSISTHNASLSWDTNANASGWVVEYATLPDFSNATAVTTASNSCHLNELVGGTTYHVRVKADCGAGSESYWTTRSFTTDICEGSDQCEISYKLADSFGDGWNDCAINVVDVATGFVFGTLTINYGDSLSGTLPICDGRDIRFEWVNGSSADETSYTVYDVEGNIIFSGSNAMSTPVSYTVNCPANPNITEIGTCTGGGNYLPVNSSSNYSISQQIYTASEINRTGTIFGISFYNAGTSQIRNYDMYLVHTNKTTFSDNVDWVAVTPADLVFSGPIELTAGSWTEFALDVPFNYNGTENLLLVMNDKTGTSAPGIGCHTFHTTELQAIYAYRNGSGYDPMFPNNIIGDYNSEKNCVRLNFGINCAKPTNLTVSENGMNKARIIWDNNSNANSWIVEYSTAADFSGSFTTFVSTNSCLLTGLTPETEYHVRVKADCGVDGESYWNSINFTTNSCQVEDQCEITYVLGDTYGDGWTGNAINVVDITSGIVLASWTIDYGSTATGSLFVCNGREIRFEWVNGADANETSYNVYDANGIEIFGGVGPFLTPFTHMVNCASSPCPTPDNLTVSNLNGGTATVSWTENGSATAWQLCLDGDEANPINVTENPYTLSGLDTTIFHNVKVRANCGSDYSFWSVPFSFAKVRSTANWYACVQRSPNNVDLRKKFISFSAQDPATVTVASDITPYSLAATCVNGVVWFFDENNTNLYKAPLDNYNKTMGTYETVASNFEGNNNDIASMSYNPVDGRIYYILYTSSQIVKLKSFDPSNINDVTEIGTFNSYALSIAIDSNGNAYCTDMMTGNLCQVNLTDATITPVGNLGFSSTMPYIAFDMNTGEMLMGQMSSSNDNGLYLVNPATAEKQLIGYIGGGTGANISGLFMANGSAPSVTCPAPANLAASNISDVNATLTWTENGNATEWQICVNGNETNLIDVTTNPYTLNGLSPETPYTVKVRANCGVDGTSDWSDVISFTTEPVVIPPYFYITGDDSICPNQTTVLHVNTNLGTDYLWNTGETSQAITVPVGNYSVTVYNAIGDEVAHGSFTVHEKESYNITIKDTICESGLPYTWNGVEFTQAGTQTLNLQAANGCDSVVTMILTTLPTYAVSDTKTVCESELPYTWNGVEFTQAGSQMVTLPTVSGCDSVVTMTLTVNSTYAVSDTKTICESELPYTWNTVVFTTAGTKDVTLQSSTDCDSVVTMTLSVNPIYSVSESRDVCPAALPYTWNGVIFNAAGDKTVTLQTVNGCDSVVTMHLTINSIYTVTDSKSICESELPITWNGVEFTQAGTQTVTLPSASGCDSVVTMTLTVNPTFAVTDTKIVCESELPYTWNGVEFSQAGTQTVTLPSVSGCDSVVTMTLIVNPTYAVTDTKTVCESELPYPWNGVEFTQAGTQMVTLQAVNSCDSVVTMTLTVNPTFAVSDTKTVCESELPYTWNGVEFSQAGTQTVTLQATNGCDSVVTMTLTVNPTFAVSDSKSICESELPYTWNGVEFTQAGTQTVTLQATNSCDSVVTMTLTVNPTYALTDTKTVCESELPYTWNGVEFSQAGTQTVTLQAANSCDSVVTMTLTVNPTYAVTDTKTVCESELPYTWNGVVFNVAGTQTVTLQAANGCDSVVTMTLTVNPTYAVNDKQTICQSELPYTWNGVEFTQAGTQTVTLQATNGCDSMVTMTLTVNPTYAVNDEQTICQSELPITWNGVDFNVAGTQTVTLQAANGCDSVVTMTLTVNPTYAVNDEQTICQSELPYTWNGVVFNVAGTQTVTLQAANGCDSVVTMTLTVNPTYTVTDVRSVCPSELPYTWNGVVFSGAGSQNVTLETVNGCDSLVIMILTVNQTHVTMDSQTICENELPYTWNGVTFNAAGVNTATLQDASGCDSTVIMTLSVNPSYSNNLSMSICESELPYTWNGVVFNAAGTQTLNLQTVNGCDSVVTMTLTTLPTYSVTDIRSVCPSELPYTWNGVVFSTAGTQTVTLQTVNGCDSVVTMLLTVNQTHVTTDSQTICENELPYTWNGVTFNAAGVNTATLQDAAGCDSTVIMTLLVNPSYSNNLSMSICESELPYTWNGVVFSTAGTQTLNLQSVNGCDSVVTMTLTTLPTYAVTDNQTICESELPYIWNGVTFTEAGTQTVTLQSVNGCDSIVTMTLTTLSAYAVTDNQTICESELPYTWNGVTFTEAGTQTVTLQSVNGCDSVVTMTLTVNNSVTEMVEVTACDSYEWNGTSYTESGDYTQTFMAANGCDSVVTLHLIVNESVTVEYYLTINESDLPYTYGDTTFEPGSVESGDYTFYLTTEAGCDSIIVLHLTVLTGIDDHSMSATVNVYPNPTTDNINLQLSMDNEPSGIVEIQVYDIYGKLLEMSEIPHETPMLTTQIDMSRYASGVYFIKLVTNDNVLAVKKVVKK